MADKDNFIKYIIKTLIKDVKPHTIEGEFVVGKLDVSDEIITQIIKEGARYDYSEKETRSLIANIAQSIVWTPSVEIIHDYLNVHGIEVGAHICLYFDNEQYGQISLSLICINTGRFFVLNSQIPGIIYHDILVSVNTLWHINHVVEFDPYRCQKRILDDRQVLRLDPIIGIELYKPSTVHEIYDSKSTFKTKTKKKAKS